ISGTRADLQHATIRTELEQLGHPCDDEGLGDRLVSTDRQSVIAVSATLQGFRHKEVARHSAHRLEYSRIADAVVIVQAGDHALSWNGVFLERTGAMSVCLLHRKRILLLNSFGVVRSLSDSSRYRAPLTHCGLSCRCEAALWKRNPVRPRNNQSPQPN